MSLFSKKLSYGSHINMLAKKLLDYRQDILTLREQGKTEQEQWTFFVDKEDEKHKKRCASNKEQNKENNYFYFYLTIRFPSDSEALKTIKSMTESTMVSLEGSSLISIDTVKKESFDAISHDVYSRVHEHFDLWCKNHNKPMDVAVEPVTGFLNLEASASWEEYMKISVEDPDSPFYDYAVFQEAYNVDEMAAILRELLGIKDLCTLASSAQKPVIFGHLTLSDKVAKNLDEEMKKCQEEKTEDKRFVCDEIIDEDIANSYIETEKSAKSTKRKKKKTDTDPRA